MLGQPPVGIGFDYEDGFSLGGFFFVAVFFNFFSHSGDAVPDFLFSADVHFTIFLRRSSDCVLLLAEGSFQDLRFSAQLVMEKSASLTSETSHDL